MSNEITPFERLRRVNPAGNEFWSSRDFANVLGCNDCRILEAVIAKPAPQLQFVSIRVHSQLNRLPASGLQPAP